MRPTLLRRGWRIAAALIGLAALALAALPAAAAPFDGRRTQFADGAFQAIWTRTDASAVRGGRSWYWGPQPWFDYAEFYRQGVNGLRTVQYFDKARMEINNPNDRSFQGGMTNGLLVVELVSGHQKKGNDPYDYDARSPADVPVAGNPKADNPNSPTYASFIGVATFDNNGYRDQNRLGQRVGASIDKWGNISARQDLADARPETEIAQFNTATNHNIPKVFWEFMTMQGPVVEDGQVRSRPIVDWLSTMGLPITDAYWVRAKIGPAEQDVLVQLFERRALTYTPGNPAGYKVEMGNVGQHYFQWRYGNLGQPWAATDLGMPLLYASKAKADDRYETWIYLATGNVQMTGDPLHPSRGTDSVPFSYRRSYDPLRACMLIDSRRDDGEHRQLYLLPILPYSFSGEFENTCLPQHLDTRKSTTDPFIPPPGSEPPIANDYNPSISPDGAKVAFASDRYGSPQIFLARTDGGLVVPLPTDPGVCTSQYPSWSPDGRSLYWERKCGDGKFSIMKGDLRYDEDATGMLYASLPNIRELTGQDADNRYPRVSPDGSKVAFTSYRDGNAEIYTMDSNGGGVARLTNSAADDDAPTWSSNGSQLAFASNRDGDYDIYMMNADGSGQVPLTNNTAEDRWPSWAQ